jgi:hypothetical protein
MEVLPELLIMARKTGSFWNGVHAALSLMPPEFEGLYRKDISSRFQLAFVFADYYVFWVAIALLFLVAAGVAIVRKQKKLAQMARDEKEDDDAEQALPIAEPLQAAPIVNTPLPVPQNGPGDQPDKQVDMGEEKYPDEDEEEDEEFEDEDDDDYILADGVELEDEEDDDEIIDEGLEEDEGEGKKS